MKIVLVGFGNQGQKRIKYYLIKNEHQKLMQFPGLEKNTHNLRDAFLF